MCFGIRSKDNGDNIRSRDIDRVLRQDEKRMAKEVKLLLLGTYTPTCHLRALQAAEDRFFFFHRRRRHGSVLEACCCVLVIVCVFVRSTHVPSGPTL